MTLHRSTSSLHRPTSALHRRTLHRPTTALHRSTPALHWMLYTTYTSLYNPYRSLYTGPCKAPLGDLSLDTLSMIIIASNKPLDPRKVICIDELGSSSICSKTVETTFFSKRVIGLGFRKRLWGHLGWVHSPKMRKGFSLNFRTER